MDAQQSPFDEFVRPSLTDEILDYLQTTVKWTQFLAIMGFISLGLVVLMAIGFMLVGSSLPGMDEAFPMGAGIFGVIYLVIAALGVYPILSLYRFSVLIKKALRGTQPEAFAEGFRHLRNHYWYSGVLTLIFLGLYGLLFVFGGMAALFT